MRRGIVRMGKMACMGLGLVMMLAAAGCQRQGEEPGAAAEAEATATPAGEPTGGDYHSTAVRARSRANDRLEKINTERTEQVEAEKSFSKPQ